MKITTSVYSFLKKSPFLFFITAFIVLATLFFGLKPKGYRFINQVRHTDEGLSFYNIGMVYSEKTLGELGIENNCTIAAVIKPKHTMRRLFRIFSLIDENGHNVVSIDQWMKGIEISIWDSKGEKKSRVGVSNLVHRHSFTPIIAGISDGSVWIYTSRDKQIIFSRKIVPLNLSRMRLIMGFGSTGENPWRGTVRYLSIDSVTPDTRTITSMFNTLSQNSAQYTSTILKAPALFDFSESENSRILYSTANSEWPLIKPALPRFFKRALPEIIPSHISHPEGFIADIVINFLGFIPFGFCLFSLLMRCNITPKKAVVVSLIVSFIVSGFIESVQIFIPTRTSQLIDVILNTCGGYLGGVFGKVIRMNHHPT